MIFDLEVAHHQELHQDIDRMGQRAADARPAFHDIFDKIMLPAARRQWGADWSPLDPDTVARKARQHQDPRVMRVTSALHNALTMGSSKTRTPGQLKTIGKTRVRLGVSGKKFPQARPLDRGMPPRGKGGGRGRARTPPRPLLNWEQRDIGRAVAILDRYLIGDLAG